MKTAFNDKGITDDYLNNVVVTSRQKGMPDGAIQQQFDTVYASLTGSRIQQREQAEAEPQDQPMQDFEQPMQEQPEFAENEKGLLKNAAGKSPMQVAYETKYGEQEGQKQFALSNQKQDELEKSKRHISRTNAAVQSLGSSLTLGGTDFLSSKENRAQIKADREAHPGYALGGTVAGFLTPGGIGSAVVKGTAKAVTKLGAKELAAKASGRLSKWAIEAGTYGAADAITGTVQAHAELANRRLAGTEEWKSFSQAASEFGGDSVGSVFINSLMRGVAPAMGAAFNKKSTAIAAMGGEENINRAFQRKITALQSGKSKEIAHAEFVSEIAAGLPPKDADKFIVTMRKNPNFNKAVTEASLGAIGVIDDSIENVTRSQIAKTTRTALEDLKQGTNLGVSDGFDTSADGVKQALGLNSQKYQEVRNTAMQRIKNLAASDSSVADSLQQSTKNMVRQVQLSDRDGVVKLINQADWNDFAALRDNPQLLDGLVKKAMAEAGGQVDPMMVAKQQAQLYAKKLLNNGTSNPQDLDDLAKFLGSNRLAEVAAGQNTPIGALREGLNSTLETLEPMLKGSNNMVRMEKVLTDAHKLGATYNPAMSGAVNDMFSNASTATDLAAKTAGFKWGVLHSVKEAAKAGESAEISKILGNIQRNPKLSGIFEPDEIATFMKTIQPETKAARNISRILTSGQASSLEDDAVKSVAKMGVAAATGAPIAFTGELLRVTRKNSFGPITRRHIEEALTNPSWERFNKLESGIKDLIERNQFHKAIKESVDTLQNQGYMNSIDNSQDRQEKENYLRSM